MKNVAIIALSALLLFSLSAALSLWLNGPGSGEKKKPEDDNARVLPHKDDDGKPSPKDDNAHPGDPPAPVIPGPGATPPGPDEAAHLLARLRERAAALDRRDAELKKREEQVRLVVEDLRGERTILDGLRKQIADELKATGDKLVEVERRAAELEEQKKDLAKAQADAQKRQVVIDGTESKNFDKMATISDSMAPESAAAIVRQLADSGRMDTAVKMLSQMKERRAAQVLAEINDPAMAAQLLDRLRGVRRETPPAAPPPAP